MRTDKADSAGHAPRFIYIPLAVIWSFQALINLFAPEEAADVLFGIASALIAASYLLYMVVPANKAEANHLWTRRDRTLLACAGIVVIFAVLSAIVIDDRMAVISGMLASAALALLFTCWRALRYLCSRGERG